MIHVDDVRQIIRLHAPLMLPRTPSLDGPLEVHGDKVPENGLRHWPTWRMATCPMTVHIHLCFHPEANNEPD